MGKWREMSLKVSCEFQRKVFYAIRLDLMKVLWRIYFHLLDSSFISILFENVNPQLPQKFVL